MAETPLAPGSAIVIEVEDSADPESPLTAFFHNPDEPDSDWTVLAWTQTGQNPEWFYWLVRSAASFHRLPVYDNARDQVFSSPADTIAPPPPNPATRADPSELLPVEDVTDE
jgi:hypothetical protein